MIPIDSCSTTQYDNNLTNGVCMKHWLITLGLALVTLTITSASHAQEAMPVEPQPPQNQPQAAPTEQPESSGIVSQEALEAYGNAIQMHLSGFNHYPEEAVKDNLEGTVIIHLRINRDGKVLTSKIAQTSGSNILDQAALAMVQEASPVPRMPDDFYPGAEQGEFMVPIVYLK